MRATTNVIRSTIQVHMKNTLARPMFQIVLVFQPFVIATTTYMVYRDANVDDFVAFVVLGGGLSGIWSAMTFSSLGDINRERWFGTLNPMLASPTSLLLVFAAKITANALLSLLSMGIAIVYSLILLGSNFAIAHGLAFVGALGLFLFSTSAFALCLSLVFLLSRTTQVMQNFIEAPLLVIGGMAFPVSILPGWAQAISALLPIRWGSETLRLTFDPAPLSTHWWTVAGLTLLSGVVYLGLATFFFRRLEHRVRYLGNLELA
ncbi:MAG: ABC transporter permease [Anaerolineae bacterium]|nr:ABC transporter permease [Anaerolineae bacterium]